MIFGKEMAAQRKGHIIHLCSNASRLSLYGSYAYNMSKHGLEGLVKTAASQFAPYGVRVNGVAPGTVETALNKKLLRSNTEENYSLRASSILAHTPTKKFATLDGISETILATCMPQKHLTGNVIFCDDGYNIEGHSWPEGNAALYGQPDELDELFGVNLLTFSNNKKNMETYKKDVDSGKNFGISKTIRPIPVKKKKKDLFLWLKSLY